MSLLLLASLLVWNPLAVQTAGLYSRMPIETTTAGSTVVQTSRLGPPKRNNGPEWVFCQGQSQRTVRHWNRLERTRPERPRRRRLRPRPLARRRRPRSRRDLRSNTQANDSKRHSTPETHVSTRRPMSPPIRRATRPAWPRPVDLRRAVPPRSASSVREGVFASSTTALLNGRVAGSNRAAARAMMLRSRSSGSRIDRP